MGFRVRVKRKGEGDGSQPELMAGCFERLGDIAWTQRHFGSSLRYNVSNLAISCKTDSLEGTLQCLRRFGDSFLREGNAEFVQGCFGWV